MTARTAGRHPSPACDCRHKLADFPRRQLPQSLPLTFAFRHCRWNIHIVGGCNSLPPQESPVGLRDFATASDG
jgi:hypothetical protein